MAKRKNDFDESASFEFINQQDAEQAEKLAKRPEKTAKTAQTEIKKESKAEEPTFKQILKEKKQSEANEIKVDEPKAKIIAESENLTSEVEEYKNLLQLTKAEFDNYRKRSFMLLQNAKTEGEINVILKFLPALDSLKKAKDMIFDEKVLKGVEMIEKDIVDALKVIGVEEINPKGKHFDANYHNALSVINNPDIEDGIVDQVYQSGYSYSGKVIRYAQVIINKT